MPTIPGQRFAGKNTNLPARSSPEAVYIPAAIAENPAKLTHWNYIVEDMQNRNCWSPTYLLTVQELVETVHRLEDTRRLLDEEGSVLPRYDSKGNEIGVMNNPRFSQMQSLQKSLFTCVEKLGLSPRDIVFLTRTDPSTEEVIELTRDKETNGVVYFR